MDTFIETNCTITHDGRTFEAGGAYIVDCTDGRRRGVVYVKAENPHNGIVTTWEGKQLARCSFVDYRGNFCKMRRVSFTLEGVNYIGDYCPNWADACKVRSTKVIHS